MYQAGPPSSRLKITLESPGQALTSHILVWGSPLTPPGLFLHRAHLFPAALLGLGPNSWVQHQPLGGSKLCPAESPPVQQCFRGPINGTTFLISRISQRCQGSILLLPGPQARTAMSRARGLGSNPSSTSDCVALSQLLNLSVLQFPQLS